MYSSSFFIFGTLRVISKFKYFISINNIENHSRSRDYHSDSPTFGHRSTSTKPPKSTYVLDSSSTSGIVMHVSASVSLSYWLRGSWSILRMFLLLVLDVFLVVFLVVACFMIIC